MMTERNATLHFTRISNEEATPRSWCLVLHGILGSGQNFRGVARALCDRRPDWGAVLVDLRMHGRSQGFAPPHDLARCAGDLVEVTRQIEGPVHAILGHSFGGKVALAYLAEHAGPLRQAWILDSNPGARPTRAGSESTLQVLDMLEQAPRSFPDRASFVAHVTAQGYDRALAQWLAMNLARGAEGYALRLQLPAIRELLDDYFARDMWHVIEHADADVELVIAGRSSVFSEADRQRAAQLARAQPERVHVHTLADAGHWLHVDDPQGLLDLLVTRMPPG